jgi:hypothetical protein
MNVGHHVLRPTGRFVSRRRPAAQRIGAQLRAPLTGQGSPRGPAARGQEPTCERSELWAASPRYATASARQL